MRDSRKLEVLNESGASTMSFDILYPDAIFTPRQAHFAPQRGGGSRVTSVGGGGLFPDTDVFWTGTSHSASIRSQVDTSPDTILQPRVNQNTRNALVELAQRAVADIAYDDLPDVCESCVRPPLKYKRTPSFLPDDHSFEFEPRQRHVSIAGSSPVPEEIESQLRITSSFAPGLLEQRSNTSFTDSNVFQQMNRGLTSQTEVSGFEPQSLGDFDRFTNKDQSVSFKQTEHFDPDQLSDRGVYSRFAGPGAIGRGPWGWKQWWRTIGYYLDEFRPPVAEKDIGGRGPRNKIMFNNRNIYLSTLPHNRVEYLLHKVGARYGRAVAAMRVPFCDDKEPKLVFSTSGCSSWLVGGQYLLSSRHCRRKKVACTESNTQIVAPLFGSFDFEQELISTGSRTFRAVDQYLRDRLLSLGIPERLLFLPGEGPNEGATPSLLPPQVWGTQLTTSDMTRGFRCEFNGTGDLGAYQNRDVDWYRCNPSKIKYELSVLQNGGNGVSQIVEESFDLMPSHVWGSISLIEANKRREGCRFPSTSGCDPQSKVHSGKHVYILQTNRAAVYGDRPQNLLSFNGVIDGAGLPNKRSFFSRDLYWEPGSSGGAVLDLFTNRALGVLSGYSYSSKPNALLRSDIVPENFDEALDKYNRQVLKFSSTADFASCPSSARQNLIRGSGAIAISDSLFCPRGMVAAGIVGSRGPLTNDRIGNFGFVCLPFGKRYLFDQARVLATGSADTARGVYAMRGSSPTFGEELNTYISEVVVRQNTSRQDLPWALSTLLSRELQSRSTVEHSPQAFAMCPPNYYMTSMIVQSDPTLSPMLLHIPVIECQNRKGQRTVTHLVPEGVGKLGGWSSQGNFKQVGCPKGCFITGLTFATDDRFPNALLPLCGRV